MRIYLKDSNEQRTMSLDHAQFAVFFSHEVTLINFLLSEIIFTKGIWKIFFHGMKPSFHNSNLQREGDEGTVPMWELRVEGRLLDEPSAGAGTAGGGPAQNRNQPLKRKFSSFFKSLVIELDKEIYGPDNHLVEWHRTPQTNETDGFQVVSEIVVDFFWNYIGALESTNFLCILYSIVYFDLIFLGEKTRRSRCQMYYSFIT